MINIVLVLAVAITIVQIISLHKMRVHDRVLFRFCRVRRELMALLRDDGYNLKRKDYEIARDMLDCVSMVIHDYKDCKQSLLNLRAFRRTIRQFRKEETDIKKVTRTDNAELNKIRKHMQFALWYGFMSYTPFLKHEFVLHVMLFVAKLLMKAGITKVEGLKSDLRWIGQTSSIFENYENGHNKGKHLRTA